MSGEEQNHLEQLITDLAASLGREIQGVKDSLQSEMRAGFAALNERFDRQGARMDKQAASIQAGALWISRHEIWSERIDTASEADQVGIAALNLQMADLLLRVEKLESRST